MKILKILLVFLIDLILTGGTWYITKNYFIDKIPNTGGAFFSVFITHIAIIVVCIVLYGVLLSYFIM